jgi:hypothetical protein
VGKGPGGYPLVGSVVLVPLGQSFKAELAAHRSHQCFTAVLLSKIMELHPPLDGSASTSEFAPGFRVSAALSERSRLRSPRPPVSA